VAEGRGQYLNAKNETARAEMSSEDGETEELDQDLDDDGWESESDDDS
jgi:hypothetical protein